MRSGETEGIFDFCEVIVEPVPIAWVLANILKPIVHNFAGLRGEEVAQIGCVGKLGPWEAGREAGRRYSGECLFGGFECV